MVQSKWYRYGKNLREIEEEKTQVKIFKIPLKLLVDRPDFEGMSKQEFTGLLDSIREHGLLKSVVVTPASSTAEPGGTFHFDSHGKYRVVCGHNRCRAIQLLGYEEIDCVIWDKPGVHNNCTNLTPISPVMDYQRKDG